MAEQDTKDIFEEQAYSSMQMVAEKALFDIIVIAFEEANTRLENAPHYFIEQVLTEVASKGSLGGIFDRKV